MIDLGVLEGTTNTLSKLNMSENIVKTGIEALQKIASLFFFLNLSIYFLPLGHPQARQAVISRNIVKDIVALLEKKAYSPVIVQSGLKFLESVAKTKEGVEYLKKDGIGMKALVSLLEKHPEEKAILNTGANILGKVATISDLTNALSSLKDGGK